MKEGSVKNASILVLTGVIIVLSGAPVPAESASAGDYDWSPSYLQTERFDGKYMDVAEWEALGDVSQDDEARLAGNGLWGSSSLFTRDTFIRCSGEFTQAKINASDGIAMWGYKRTDSGYGYEEMVHAVHLRRGRISIYEEGNKRVEIASKADGTLYEFKIELKESGGALYYYRESGAASWIQMHDSDYSTESPLSKGILVHSGEVYLDDMLVNSLAENSEVQEVVESKRSNVEINNKKSPEGSKDSPPIADAGGPYHFNIGMQVLFNGSGSYDDNGITQWEWDFGDSSTGGGMRPVHTYSYSSTGTYQWASSATASSEYSTSSGSAAQATGSPNVSSCAHSGSAWTTASEDMGEQWLELTYSSETAVDFIAIRETFNPGFVTRIEAHNENDEFVAIWQGNDDAACLGYLVAEIEPAYTTDTIRIYCNTDVPGWNEIDAVKMGERPDAQVQYTVTLTVHDGSGNIDTDVTTVTLDTGPLALCVPWQFEGATEIPHPVWYENVSKATQTNTVRLKAIAKGVHTPLTYLWDFGDGATDGPHTVSNAYAVETTHQYTGVSEGQPITATLTVWDDLGSSSTDEYPMLVQPKGLDVEADIAVDEGLWYMHKQQARSGGISGSWLYNGWNPFYAAATASSIQAFEINGHLESGDMMEDPYVETVLNGMRYLLTELQSFGISNQPAGNPDSNGNGIGLQTKEQRPAYSVGMVIDALAASDTPDYLAETGGTNVIGRTYYDIVVDCIDAYAYGQRDAPNADKGGWRYTWNDASDNSVNQWAVIGMSAAEDHFGVEIPEWLKTENIYWLNYSFNASYGTYGYQSSSQGGHGWYATTASAMVQVAFDGITTDNTLWSAPEDYFANQWSTFLNSDNTYAHFAFVKAARLAQPEPVVTLSATGLDWYNDPTNGLKRHLVDDQGANGSWGTNGWPYAHVALTDPWCVIMLTSTLFTRPPVALIKADGSTVTELYWGQGLELCLDGSASYHLDPNKQIASYAWDLDEDGQFDDCLTAVCCETWDNLGDYTVTLKVTDNGSPAQQDTVSCLIHIVPPPHAPFSVIGGPYEAVAGFPIQLDGSGSYDIDPTDYITEYWWDLDGQPWNFDSVQGGSEAATITHTFNTPGTQQIGLKVWDNGVFNEDVKMDDNSYTTVEVEENLAPVAIAGGPYEADEGSALNLDGSASYDPNDNTIEFAWDLDNDGQYDDSSSPQPSWTWMDDGLYTVGLQVTDTLLTGYDTAQVTVNDLGPTAAVNGPGALYTEENGTFDASGSTSYPDTIDLYEWDWDYDGSTFNPSGDTGVSVQHSWATPVTATVAVRVTDEDGSTDIASMTVEVTPPPTNTPTNTPTLTPTATLTPTLSPSPTDSPTFTPTLTPTLSPTGSPTFSPSPTDSPTLTPTLTPSMSPTETPTLTPSMSPTESPTLTPSPTDSPTLTPTLSPTPTYTDTPEFTPTITVTPTTPPIPTLNPGGIILLIAGLGLFFLKRSKE